MSSSSPIIPVTKIATHKSNSPAKTPDQLAFLIDKSKTIEHLQQIHAFLVRHDLDNHAILNFKLQRSYSSLGHLRQTVKLFGKTHNPNVFFYTALIHSHAAKSLHGEALLYYVRMRMEDVDPTAHTLSAILKGCPYDPGRALHCQAVKLGLDCNDYVRTGIVDVYARSGDMKSARKLFDEMPDWGLVAWTTMMAGYAKSGDVVRARALFDEMEQRDVVSWNVMIDGYSQHGRCNEALVLFREMLSAKVKPDEVTMLAVLSACGQLGALESAQWVHSYLENNGVSRNLRVATALVDMYSKCGSLESARMVFDGIRSKDVVSWNAMIVGYAMHGLSREALDLYHEMLGKGMKPTHVTFIGVLNACAHAGLVSQGWEVFNSMSSEYRVEARIEHYGCMVNLLGRAGHLKEAYQLIKDMKIERDFVIWSTLLAACKLHKDANLAEEIVGYLTEQNGTKSGAFVLLSNIYAEAGNWEGVARVRSAMKETGVKKEPGCSAIEVNNEIHEFLAGDMKHPKSREIYAKLDEIRGWLDSHGYAPMVDMVLHDLNEAEKRRSLEIHSERLAIAFGLISTEKGGAIKIVKNLRVCMDCHAVTKLISKITGRKIVVRDRNRFHHFVDGSCSCGDYW